MILQKIGKLNDTNINKLQTTPTVSFVKLEYNEVSNNSLEITAFYSTTKIDLLCSHKSVAKKAAPGKTCWQRLFCFANKVEKGIWVQLSITWPYDEKAQTICNASEKAHNYIGKWLSYA